MVNRSAGHVPPVTHKDLLIAGKAIHDQVRDGLRGDVKTMEAELGLRLGKLLEARLDKAMVEAVDARLKAMEESQSARLGALEAEHRAGMERLERLILALQVPPPVVHVSVPEQPAPTVNVLAAETPAPVVNVLPAEVRLPAPVAHFTLPELTLPAPVVNVAAPEIKGLPAPVVHVNVPRKGKTVKNIEFDQYGRPVRVEEEEVE